MKKRTQIWLIVVTLLSSPVSCKESNSSNTSLSSPSLTNNSRQATINTSINSIFTYASTTQDYVVLKYDSAGKQLWKARYNGPDNDVDQPAAMAIDDNGNVYVTGWSNRVRGNGLSREYATVKYNNDGKQLWAVRYSGQGGGNNFPGSLALDKQGNVLVTGSSSSQNGGSDSVIVKYDSQGHQISVTPLNGPENSVAGPMDSNGNIIWLDRHENLDLLSMTIDAAGNVYVTGYSRGNGLHFVTLKYDPNGKQLWASVLNEQDADRDDVPYDIAVDKAGNVFVAGRSRNTTQHYGAGIVKYDSQGKQAWATRYTSNVDPTWRDDQVRSLALDPQGNLYVLDESQNPNGGRSLALLKYSTDGKLLWQQRYDGQGDNLAASVAVDKDGDILVSGRSRNADGSWVISVVKYDGTGKQIWASRSTEQIADGGGMMLDKQGNVYLLGTSAPKQSNDDIVFPPGGFTYRANVHQAGQPDQWPPILQNSTTVKLPSSSIAITYRDYIETKAGENRNNIIFIDCKNASEISDPLDIQYHAEGLPPGITFARSHDMHGGIGGQGGRSGRVILVVHVADQIKPGEYKFSIVLEYQGKDIGSIPGTVKVVN